MSTAPTLLIPSRFGASELELLLSFATAAEGTVTLDARALRWIDPYAALALRTLAESLPTRPTLISPRAKVTGGESYPVPWLHRAEEVFTIEENGLQRGPQVVLAVLPPTRIRTDEDVYAVVGDIQDSGWETLPQLGYSKVDAMMFTMIVSELAQNILEHAHAPGWAAAWTCRTGEGTPELHFVVADCGIGFAQSLGMESDADAVLAGGAYGATRFKEPGRGQGLKQVSKRVQMWGGYIWIRSGAAVMKRYPGEAEEPTASATVRLPGSIVRVVLPAKIAIGPELVK